MNKFLLVIVAVIGLISVTALGLSLTKEGSVSTIVKEFGAASGPELPFDHLTVNDVASYFARDTDLTAATTTVCALQSPAATSTLVAASITFSTGTTTQSIVHIARSATAYATTTLLDAALDFATSTQATFNASTTKDNIFSPDTFLVVGMAINGPVCAAGDCTFSPVGVCQAEWRVN